MKRLKDILPKNFARPEMDKCRLGDVVDLFTNVRMIEQGDEKDVVRTLVEVLQPFKGRVYESKVQTMIQFSDCLDA